MNLSIENTLLKLHLLPVEESNAFQEVLAEHINELIQNKFNQLVQLLYRLDVDEQRLKTLLKTKENRDAGSIIASMIIERQFQKINLEKTQTGDENIPDEDSW